MQKGLNSLSAELNSSTQSRRFTADESTHVGVWKAN